MPFDAVFDANAVQPKQGGGAHPVGNKFPFRITDTKVEPTKDGKGGKFVVELASEVGSISHNYNLWNESDAARRISGEQLSALCHAVGIFKVDFKNDGAALRGGMGMMDIGFQKGHEPSAEKPEGGYVEVKKVYDRNGNEPGKPPQTAQNNGQQNGQYATHQANAAPTNNAGGGWQGNGAAPQANHQQTEQQPQANQASGWQQNAAGEKPPWG